MDKELDEIAILARGWVKYISVATLQGENALTRKGVEDAISGYSNVTEDFTNWLQALITKEKNKLLNELIEEAHLDQEYDEHVVPVDLIKRRIVE